VWDLMTNNLVYSGLEVKEKSSHDKASPGDAANAEKTVKKFVSRKDAKTAKESPRCGRYVRFMI
jgi:hypothetical protein